MKKDNKPYKKLWIKVTTDEYRLPVAVAGDYQELAKMVGVAPNSIIQYISHMKKHPQKNTAYEVIEFTEEEWNEDNSISGT